MEFVRQSSSSGDSHTRRIHHDGLESKRKPKTNGTALSPTHVRVNWYFRVRDLQHRKHADPRLLIATMHSDLCHISTIRGICTVKHVAYISDIQSYRKLPDHFYFSQVWDKYIQRYYEAVPTEKVRNVPAHIGEALKAKYKYVIVELGKGKDLTDTQRACHVCCEWCASNDSVRCGICKNYFHMACLHPPLLKKPSKGYSWYCAPCSRDHEIELKSRKVEGLITNTSGAPLMEEEDDLVIENGEPLTNGPRSPYESSPQIQQPKSAPSSLPTSALFSPTRLQVDTQGLSSPRSENKPNLWDMRYFGIHSSVNDILDYDDRIQPKAASRIGSRHQANVPDWTGKPVPYGQEMSRETSSNQSKKRSKYAKGKWLPPDTTCPRGTEATVENIFINLDNDFDDVVDTYMRRVSHIRSLPLPAHSIPIMHAALKRLQDSNFNVNLACATLSAEVQSLDDLDMREWTARDKQLFEDGVRKHGRQLGLISRELRGKNSGEVVSYYYHWKKTSSFPLVYGDYCRTHKPDDRKYGTSALYQSRKGRRSKGGDSAAGGRKSSHNGTVSDNSEDSESESMIVPKESKKYICEFCGNTASETWRRAPISAHQSIRNTMNGFQSAICKQCGDLWRRYGIVREPSEGEMRLLQNQLQSVASKKRPVKKREAEITNVPPPKKAKLEDKSIEKTPTPEPPSVCLVCGNIEPHGELLSCIVCKMTIHANCYGAREQKGNKDWACEMCINDANPQVSTSYYCVLCPRAEDENRREPLKRTAGNNWAHVTCATWIPEVKFADVETLQPIESIGTIPMVRWESLCVLCETSNGACIQCPECRVYFHVTCAIENGYRAGFDVSLIKSSRRDTIPTVKFKAESGVMSAHVWCPSHDKIKGPIYRMREYDKSTKMNAMHTYIRTYKASNINVTGSMRKARNVLATSQMHRSGGVSIYRKLSFISTVGSTTRDSPSAAFEKDCAICGIDVSPIWWPYEEGMSQTKHQVKIESLDSLQAQSQACSRASSIKMEDELEDNAVVTSGLWLGIQDEEACKRAQKEAEQLRREKAEADKSMVVCQLCYFDALENGMIEN